MQENRPQVGDDLPMDDVGRSQRVLGWSIRTRLALPNRIRGVVLSLGACRWLFALRRRPALTRGGTSN
jgi:hypothetical protein